MITRKHYVKIAQAINKGLRRDSNKPDHVINELMNVLAVDNKKFDRVRFWNACVKETELDF